MPPRTIVVTGAGRGLGRATALGFARAGWNVVLAGRSLQALEGACAEAGAPARTLPVACDVTDPEAVERLFEAAVQRFGRVDVLFNNAGTFQGSGPLDALAANDWRSVIDVNLSGAFFCAQAAFRRMKQQQPPGGRIINNGSLSAHVPRPHAVAYTASKHAITGLTKALALEGRPFGIACGQIDIGNAASDMTRGIAAGMLQADGAVRPEPVMDARHVVDAVLHMAQLPPEANVHRMTVMASAMPYVGRG